VLLLQENSFAGSTDFVNLPHSLHSFNVSNTRLEGTMVAEEEKDFIFDQTGIRIVKRNAMDAESEM